MPEPLPTTQFWLRFVGCAETVTVYALPSVREVGNVNEPSAATGRSCPPLTSSVRPDPARPLMLPPIENALVTQLTCTFVTVPVAVPLPLATEQVWLRLLGCVATVTS